MPAMACCVGTYAPPRVNPALWEIIGSGRPEGDLGPANPPSDQTTVRRTSTLPRVAFE